MGSVLSLLDTDLKSWVDNVRDYAGTRGGTKFESFFDIQQIIAR